MDTRSPLEGIFNIIGGGLPQGHDKPVKHALYNAVALLLLVLCCAAGWALFVILEPFMKPLMWALLVGSVLHPLKRSLRDTFQNWLQILEEAHTPLVVGLFLLPVNIINNMSECIGDILWKHIKIIFGVSIIVLVVPILYFYTPGFLTTLIWKLFWLSNIIVNYVLSITSFSVMCVGLVFYLSLVYILWKPENNQAFHYSSVAVWLIICLTFANQFGSFGLPVFVVLQLVILGGFVSELHNIYEQKKEEGIHMSFYNLLQLAFQGEKCIDEVCNESENEASNNSKDSQEDKMDETAHLSQEKRKNSVKFADEPEPLDTSVKSSDTKKPVQGRDPLALELFEDAPIKHETISRTNSELSNASYIITNQGIHVIQPKSALSEIHKSKNKKKYNKLHRSLSQPQFFANNRTESSFFPFGINLYKKNISEEVEEEKHGSTFYLYSLLWACGAMLFWKNVTLLPLLSLPILFYTCKHIGLYLGIWQCVYTKFCLIMSMVQAWCYERHDAIVPLPIRGLYKVIYQVNMSIKTFIKNSIDTVSSCVVILGLIIFLFCASVFILIQIYAEAILLVQITSDVINQTVVHNPELRQILPPTFDDTVDSILDNAYQYGREGISKAVQGLMTDVDSAKSEKIEKQILELWDRVYQSWMTANSQNGPTVTQEAVMSSWEAFVSDIKKSPEMFNIGGLIDFGKQNIGTLMSLVESIWSIVKGNINLILGSVGAFLSVLLGGGTAVLNFILNTVVFLTTLFYLLNSSGDLYKPVEIMTNFSPSGSRFGHALESAINGVFAASFKMAAFYGLWTWFIHNLFGVRIVYLPSAFATILGAVPFLGTYWAGAPAVLDLWLAQDRGLAAIFFAGFQFLPTSVVDTTIYTEIKGGHPYLTGLAIAGGVFCLGVEGAIIGPILLCGLYVAMDLSSNMFKESPSEETLNVRNVRLHQLQEG